MNFFIHFPLSFKTNLPHTPVCKKLVGIFAVQSQNNQR